VLQENPFLDNSSIDSGQQQAGKRHIQKALGESITGTEQNFTLTFEVV
jgi:hypothetical protein